VALKQLVVQLSDEDFHQARVYRWLKGTIVRHYQEHPLPTVSQTTPPKLRSIR
jgi:hypothetical protein